MIRLFNIKIGLALLGSISLLEVVAQDKTLNAFLRSDFPLFKSSTIKGKPMPGIGLSFGLTPDSSAEAYGIDPNILLIFEYGIPIEEKAELPMDGPSTTIFYDYGTVKTSLYRFGGEFGIGFNAKKNKRKICPGLGLYFYQYIFDYTYLGSNTVAANFALKGPGLYQYKSGFIGFNFSLTKYYSTKKLKLFWSFAFLIQSLDIKRTDRNSYLDSMPLYAFNLKTGICLNTKPIIDKISKY